MKKSSPNLSLTWLDLIDIELEEEGIGDSSNEE